MNRTKLKCFIFAAMMTGSLLAYAQEGGAGWLKVGNFLNLEYDDNIYELSDDPEDSFKISDQIDLTAVIDRDPTYITLRYAPTFVYWNDRDPDDTDLHHAVDAVLDHQFSPRVGLSLKDLMRISEQPEEILRGSVVRENGDYLYNESSASLDLLALPVTHVVLAGRYTIIDYDDDQTSITEDRGIAAYGATIRHKLNARANIIADYRREDIAYDDAGEAALRDSSSDFIGLGYEQVSGDFVGILRGGYQYRDYENDDLEDKDEPYGDLTITYVFSPRTRLSLGAAFSMLESELSNYANQDRTIFTAGFNHELTAKIGLFLGASYRLSQYDRDSQVVNNPADPESGDETATQVNVRANYKVDARNSIEFNFTTLDVTSDYETEFDRNRVSIGWRLDI